MIEEWQFQIRLDFADEFVPFVRSYQDNSKIKPIFDILKNLNAALVGQLDAFEGYVAQAEKEGAANFPLYKWTKSVIEDPIKRAKYAKIFTIYVDGNEVYSKKIADSLEIELHPFVEAKLLTRLSKHDTNPANNPQVPAQHRS